MAPGGAVSISISGTFSATVTLQRMLDGSNWRNVPLPDSSAGWTAPTEMTYLPDEPGYLRLGVLSGNYSSGGAVCRLGTN